MKWDRDSTIGDLKSILRQQQESGEVDEAAVEYSLDELREFLEADLADVPADLEFKRNLREKLWELVQTRNRMRGNGDPS